MILVLDRRRKERFRLFPPNFLPGATTVLVADEAVHRASAAAAKRPARVFTTLGVASANRFGVPFFGFATSLTCYPVIHGRASLVYLACLAVAWTLVLPKVPPIMSPRA